MNERDTPLYPGSDPEDDPSESTQNLGEPWQHSSATRLAPWACFVEGDSAAAEVGPRLETFDALRALAPGTLVKIVWPTRGDREFFKVLPPPEVGSPVVLMTSEARNVQGVEFSGSISSMIDGARFELFQSRGVRIHSVPEERGRALREGGLQFCDELYREWERRTFPWEFRASEAQEEGPSNAP